MKFAFIAKHRSIWPVAWLCNALGVPVRVFMPGSVAAERRARR